MVAVIIPSLNAGDLFKDCVSGIKSQTLEISTLLLMDSCSNDETVQIAADAGFRVEFVQKGTFDHGGTRARAVELVTDEIVVFLTQDAVLSDTESLARLVAIFDDQSIAAAYGRQLPHSDASPISAHTRSRNYGEHSYTTSLISEHPKGIRKAYMSNSFAAYRRSALIDVGNFESKLIFGEDFVIAAKMLKAGYHIAYVANATIRHSHNYTIKEEFKRYFDIGVLHSSQQWLLKDLGSAEGEGVKFATNQIIFLWNNKYRRYIPKSIIYSLAKYAGYKLGLNFDKLGPGIAKKIALNKNFFN